MNNQDNSNNNPQTNILNNKPLNVIPKQNNDHQFDDAFIKKQSNDNMDDTQDNNYINPINSVASNLNNSNNNVEEEINPLLNNRKNRFINNDIDTTSTSLNSMNINTESLNLPKIDYSKDPKVQENLTKIKNNTVNVGNEGIVFIIIIVILFLFIFIMPTIFDKISSIKYQ